MSRRMRHLKIVFLSLFAWLQASILCAGPDVEGKVVLANLDRYNAVLRIGQIRREIKPRKASLLTPRKYPVTIEFWSGNTKAGWKSEKIAKAGLYGLNFKRGSWQLKELKRSAARPSAARLDTRVIRQAPSARPAPSVIRQRIVQRPVRRWPINVDRIRWSPLARAAYAAGQIYQFVRDEQDRDLLRHLLIRAREDEDWDRLEDWIRDSKIPELYKDDLRDAFEDLGRLSDKDWQEIDTADEKDWEEARTDLGGLVSDAEWVNLEGDFADIDTADYWENDVDVDLGELAIVDNVDFDDGHIDIGEDIDLSEDYDVGDMGIDGGSYDLGSYDDYGGYDGAFDVDVGDYGGGYFGDDDLGDFGGFDDFDF